MGVTTPHTHPAPNGGSGLRPVGSVAHHDHLEPTRIVLGPRTRAHMAALLETPLSAVWQALLETSGVPEGAPYALVISAAHLQPAPRDGEAPPAASDGTPGAPG